MIRKIVTILIFMVSFFSVAQEYKGTIGKYEIYLYMDFINEESVESYYFYKSRLKNIKLEGKLGEDKIVLHEFFTAIEDEKELFRLKREGKNLIGTWQNGTTVLRVALTPIKNELDTFKKDRITFIRDSVQKIGARELVWLKEKYSNQSLFRLGNGFSKAERFFLNPRLDEIHKENALTELDCQGLAIEIKPRLISNDYFSFTTYSTVYCGGAHPNHNIKSYNFDFKKAKGIEKIEALFPNLDYKTMIYEKYKSDPMLDKECQYFETDHIDIWDYIDWVLTEKGIEITPSFPHAFKVCEQPFLLTHKEINK